MLIPPASPASTPATRTVLVVEDEADVRELIREVLHVERYAVLVAQDRESALAVAERHAGPIDLLITDLFLPTTGGMALEQQGDLAQQVVEMRPGIKVIYVSGYLEADMPPPALRLGPLLPKPFTIGALTRLVSEVLNGKP